MKTFKDKFRDKFEKMKDGDIDRFNTEVKHIKTDLQQEIYEKLGYAIHEKTGQKHLNIEDSIYSYTFLSMIKEVKLNYELNEYVDDYFFKSTIIFTIQLAVTSIIYFNAKNGEDELEFMKPTV